MPLWLPPTAAEQPDLTLIGWAVFKVLAPEIGYPTEHLVGYNERGVEGRVSSPVQSFDAKNRCGVTSTGRVYRLNGRPGMGSEASYVWDKWRRIWSAEVLEELSQQVLDEFTEASRPDGVE